MTNIPLVADSRGHMTRVLKDLLSCGWRLESVPTGARIPRNGMQLHLRSDGIEVRLRVFGFKVTTSGRNRPHERRVELTTTYESGLSRIPGCRDIVLGVDVESNKYVGVDSRRLHIGGATHNASSFFDLEGLSGGSGELMINPRVAAASVFASGTEHHAFFDRTRMAEYFFSSDLIHSGAYTYGGPFSGVGRSRSTQLPEQIDRSLALGDAFVLSARSTARPRPPQALIEAFESNDYPKIARRKVTPSALKAIQAICEEVGALGEQFVLDHERRRLRKLGHVTAASRVERISLRSVGEGYDIVSFEDDGRTPRYIEVKATVGNGLLVDLSAGEWRAAQSHGTRYYVARVRNVRTDPELLFFNNPVRLEEEGRIERTATGWRLDLANAV
jgi:Domain of unknown function (DUF3883)